MFGGLTEYTVKMILQCREQKICHHVILSIKHVCLMVNGEYKLKSTCGLIQHKEEMFEHFLWRLSSYPSEFKHAIASFVLFCLSGHVML